MNYKMGAWVSEINSDHTCPKTATSLRFCLSDVDAVLIVMSYVQKDAK